jgi:putative tryptophan/tyrosine transport system substrate-binding protein
MRRRDFIIGLGTAAGLLLWPLAANAQRAKRRVGVLTLGNADAESFGAQLREGLRKSGFVEEQNIQYEFRPAGGNVGLLPRLAAELVALKVDVIVALFTPCALARNRRPGKFQSSACRATRSGWA